MKIGAMTNPGLALIPQIHWIGRNGFDYVDLALEPPRGDLQDIRVETLLEALREHNLGIVVHTSPHLPVANPHRAAREVAKEEMSQALHLAVDLGSPLLTTHYLGGPPLFRSMEILEIYTRLLKELTGKARNTGLIIAIENSPVNRAEVFLFREIFKQVPDVQLLLDIGHTHINTEEDTAQDFLQDDLIGRRLCHVHVSDNDGEGDLHLPLGATRRGVDWERMVRLLKGHGYDGTVTLEVFSPDPGYLLASRDKFRSLWEA